MITIIILMILAGVAIGTLKNTKLFENAKNAKEKYQVAKQDEEDKLNEYDDIIKNSRETITVDKEEYENLKIKNAPNTWKVNVEINFGEGIFGKRYQGEGGTLNIPYNYNIIDYGGWANEGPYRFPMKYFDGTWATMIYSTNSDNSFYYIWTRGNTITNKDVWILYTKN